MDIVLLGLQRCRGDTHIGAGTTRMSEGFRHSKKGIFMLASASLAFRDQLAGSHRQETEQLLTAVSSSLDVMSADL
jgi:hypothetical protein